jgi:hypothetical protein
MLDLSAFCTALCLVVLLCAARTLALNDFSKKSTAPIFMASTASGTSPWPVMDNHWNADFELLQVLSRAMADASLLSTALI